MYILEFFIHSFIDGHLGCFHLILSNFIHYLLLSSPKPIYKRRKPRFKRARILQRAGGRRGRAKPRAGLLTSLSCHGAVWVFDELWWKCGLSNERQLTREAFLECMASEPYSLWRRDRAPSSRSAEPGWLRTQASRWDGSAGGSWYTYEYVLLISGVQTMDLFRRISDLAIKILLEWITFFLMGNLVSLRPGDTHLWDWCFTSQSVSYCGEGDRGDSLLF